MEKQKIANVTSQFRKGMYEPVEGGRFVIAKNKKSNRAVVATTGGFGSKEFDEALIEADQFGARGLEVVIACGSITYDSPRIRYVRADFEEEFLADAVTDARMHSVRACKALAA